MSAAQRSMGTPAFTSSTSLAVVVPASAVAGDLLVAFVDYVEGGTAGPAGWTRQVAASADAYVFTKFCATGDPGASITFTTPGSGFGASSYYAGVIGSYQAVNAVDAVAQAYSYPNANVGQAAPNVTTSHDGDLIVEAWFAGTGADPLAPPTTSRLNSAGTSSRVAFAISDQTQAKAGQFTGPTCRTSNNTQKVWRAATIALYGNRAPNAPVPPSLPDPFNLLQPLTVNPVFSDPDPGDTPSRLWVRYRSATASPTPDWTVLSQTGAGQMYKFPGSYFSADRYEFQFAYQDAQGTPSDQSALVWSSSVFATAAVPSNAPTITSPVNGAAIGTSSVTVTLNFPGGDAFRYYATLADGTSLVPLTTVTDPDQVASRQFTISGLANNTSIKIFAAYHDGNGWTSYAESDNPISYSPPPAAYVFLQPVDEPPTVDVTYSTPTPGDGQPPATFARIRISLDGGNTSYLHRDAQMLPTSGTWRYWTPAAGQDYSFQVETVADNGTVAHSPWVSMSVGAYGSGVYGAGVYGGGT